MTGRGGIRTVAACSISLAVVLLCAAPVDAAPVRFAKPVFVDHALAGGEPLVITDTKHHTLIYTAHEGTTHLYRNGIVNPTDFVANYRNQVNIWVSKNDGRTWTHVDFAGTGFDQPPTQNTGFSDPDLTKDQGGRVYNTGIDLANDALFSTANGGYNWDRGTAQCHDGDRPWLAGGRRDEVFMGTDTQEGTISHQIFQSTDGGNTCSLTGVPDGGTLSDGTDYSGDGKLLYDHHNGRLMEPVVFSRSSGGPLGSTKTLGVGAATWKRGQASFNPPVLAATTTLFAHWPSLALDSADNAYLVWDTDPRKPGTSGGCNSDETELPNAIQMSVSRDFGKHWSKPINIAKPAGKKVYWPWVTAGKAGKVSVVWYQTDKVVDLDCQSAKTSVYNATILNALSRHPTRHVVNAAGRLIHNDNVCQGGTTCVATGQDRRLGDFFTNAIDPRGCVLIASGDTTVKGLDGTERPTSLPIFMRQSSGPGLKGKSCGSSKRKHRRHRHKHKHGQGEEEHPSPAVRR